MAVSRFIGSFQFLPKPIARSDIDGSLLLEDDEFLTDCTPQELKLYVVW